MYSTSYGLSLYRNLIFHFNKTMEIRAICSQAWKFLLNTKLKVTCYNRAKHCIQFSKSYSSPQYLPLQHTLLKRSCPQCIINTKREKKRGWNHVHLSVCHLGLSTASPWIVSFFPRFHLLFAVFPVSSVWIPFSFSAVHFPHPYTQFPVSRVKSPVLVFCSNPPIWSGDTLRRYPWGYAWAPRSCWFCWWLVLQDQTHEQTVHQGLPRGLPAGQFGISYQQRKHTAIPWPAAADGVWGSSLCSASSTAASRQRTSAGGLKEAKSSFSFPSQPHRRPRLYWSEYKPRIQVISLKIN